MGYNVKFDTNKNIGLYNDNIDLNIKLPFQDWWLDRIYAEMEDEDVDLFLQEVDWNVKDLFSLVTPAVIKSYMINKDTTWKDILDYDIQNDMYFKRPEGEGKLPLIFTVLTMLGTAVTFNNVNIDSRIVEWIQKDFPIWFSKVSILEKS